MSNSENVVFSVDKIDKNIKKYLLNHVLKHSDIHNDPSPDTFKKNIIYQDLKNKGDKIYIHKENGIIKGFASYYIDPIAIVNIRALYVYPKYRRKGVAKSILTSIFDFVGNPYVYIVCTKKNELVTFYQKLGFKNYFSIHSDDDKDARGFYQLAFSRREIKFKIGNSREGKMGLYITNPPFNNQTSSFYL